MRKTKQMKDQESLRRDIVQEIRITDDNISKLLSRKEGLYAAFSIIDKQISATDKERKNGAKKST